MWAKYLKLYFSLKLWSVFIAHHCLEYGDEGRPAAPWAHHTAVQHLGVLNNVDAETESETLAWWCVAVEHTLVKVGQGGKAPVWHL